MNTLTVRRKFSLRTALARLSLVVLATLYLGLLALPVFAHHSVAMFDSSREVVLEGTVRVMEWANPHVWIRLEVADEAGETVEWGIEASNPLDLQRKGWSRTTFEPGDEVSITIHPAKNDKAYGSFVHATLADGSYLGEGSVSGEIDTPNRESD